MTTWADAELAAALFAVDPVATGGVVVRCGPGPVRELWLDRLRAWLPDGAPQGRIPLHIEDGRLLGGLDLGASLAAGRPVIERGVLAASDGGVAFLSMAERIDDGAGARLAAVLDEGQVVLERDGLAARLPARLGLVALDEGAAPEERPPEALLDRLALHLDLTETALGEVSSAIYSAGDLARARARLPQLAPPSQPVVEALCQAAQALGLGSLRSSIQAVGVAGLHAALAGRTEIGQEDAAAAARLVLAPRAQAPGQSASSRESEPLADAGLADTSPPPPEQRHDDRDPDGEEAGASQAEMLIAAVRAELPDDLLAEAKRDLRKPGRTVRGRGTGAAAKSARRGRPVGSRAGALRSGDRLDLAETLRAAAPWQRLRKGERDDSRLQIRLQDFRIRRFVQRREATTIFLVDASGSAAVQRLAEAKGAVELLLARAYVSRARVALVSFRNAAAEILLEPTRSLTRAKRQLADLPGGGGTPLAAGIDAGLRVARAEQARDRTPLLVILTDGRANIARDGVPGRAAAEGDAMAAAKSVREAGVDAVFIDTSPRARPDADRFAVAMGASYALLPRVDARAVSGLVEDARAGGR